jgi:hypothetical protein
MKKKKIEVKAIDCASAVARFNDFIDNYLKGRAKEELTHHLSECKTCFERLEFEQMLKSKVRDLPKDGRNASLMKRIEKLLAAR